MQLMCQKEITVTLIGVSTLKTGLNAKAETTNMAASGYRPTCKALQAPLWRFHAHPSYMGSFSAYNRLKTPHMAVMAYPRLRGFVAAVANTRPDRPSRLLTAFAG